MKRSRLALLPALLFLPAGCRSPAPPAAPDVLPPAAAASDSRSFPLTVTDSDGRRVRIAAPPRRIVSLAAAHTETLYALGAGERVAAADTYSDYPPEAKRKATLSCWPHPPLEKIVAERPDLVLVFTQSGEELRQMETAGLTVLKLFPTTYDGVLAEIRLLGQATGTAATAEEIVRTMRARRAAVRQKVRGVAAPRVLYELDASVPSRPYVAGGGGFYGELLATAGGANIFADLRARAAQVGTEQILARDPQVILLGDTRSPAQPQSPASVRSRPGWNTLSAVRSGRVYPIDSERVTRPAPRLAEGLEEIARRLHPERFR